MLLHPVGRAEVSCGLAIGLLVAKGHGTRPVFVESATDAKGCRSRGRWHSRPAGQAPDRGRRVDDEGGPVHPAYRAEQSGNLGEVIPVWNSRFTDQEIPASMPPGAPNSTDSREWVIAEL
jgi:hypothetical protein